MKTETSLNWTIFEGEYKFEGKGYKFRWVRIVDLPKVCVAKKCHIPGFFVFFLFFFLGGGGGGGKNLPGCLEKWDANSCHFYSPSFSLISSLHLSYSGVSLCRMLFAVFAGFVLPSEFGSFNVFCFLFSEIFWSVFWSCGVGYPFLFCDIFSLLACHK